MWRRCTQGLFTFAHTDLSTLLPLLDSIYFVFLPLYHYFSFNLHNNVTCLVSWMDVEIAQSGDSARTCVHRAGLWWGSSLNAACVFVPTVKQRQHFKISYLIERRRANLHNKREILVGVRWYKWMVQYSVSTSALVHKLKVKVCCCWLQVYDAHLGTNNTCLLWF